MIVNCVFVYVCVSHLSPRFAKLSKVGVGIGPPKGLVDPKPEYQHNMADVN